MRTIGLLGGMSWESSALYYRLINEDVRSRLGGTHSASVVLYSFDFASIEALQEQNKWQEAADELANAARALEQAGAGLVVLCTNTMHRLAPAIEAAITVPFVHIADAAGRAVRADGRVAVGLLGTRYTMEGDFYRRRLERQHGLKVLLPAAGDRQMVHDVIYRELVRGVETETSRQAYERVIADLFRAGAEGIVLGCTEIELLIDPESDSRLYPTTAIHARAAVDLALADHPGG